ncbi:uncharacterized protein METZ01_LOCUS252864, partial [marine metagenome]
VLNAGQNLASKYPIDTTTTNAIRQAQNPLTAIV